MLHNVSDALIWLAYLAIPFVLVFFARRVRGLPFPWLFPLFGAFITLCGSTHLMEVIVFYTPLYRFIGCLKLVTGVVSWATVVALIRVIPRALVMRGPSELERQVIRRTKELEETNSALQAEISERQRAEARFRLVVESAPNAMVMSSQEGQIVLVNAQTEKLFGYDRSELLGQTVELLVPDRFRENHPGSRADFFACPEARAMGVGRDLFGRRKDGSEFPVEIGLNPINTEQGITVLSAIVDITERKRAEQELAERAKDLARSNVELGQFAYVASHDLQEPLRMVGSFAQLLAKRYAGKLDASADDFIAYIVGGANRMQELINDLLMYSRVGTTGAGFKPTECVASIQRALANLETPISQTGAMISHALLPRLNADATQLTQLFQNLIGNAIKFHCGSPPRVQIEAARQGAEWIFSVRDNGIGFDAKHAERIFVIFQRLHNRDEYPGTGIGLAICKKIVARHGGRIWAESDPGQGACFFFTIPAMTESN